MIGAEELKQGLKRTLYLGLGASSQLVGLVRDRRPWGPPPLLRVLMYHKVNDARENAPNVPPHLFARQMELLANDYCPIALGDLVAALDGVRPLPDRAVLVTFDDGYRDNLMNAAPILRRLGVPAVIFLPTGFLGSQVPLPHDEHRARRGLHNPTLAWDEARALLDYGFEIGSHGVSHRILTRLPAGEAATEIRRSKEELEARIGVPIRSFAYVKGELDSFDSNAIDAVRDAGYQVAFSTLPGAVRLDDPRWTLRRYNVEPFSLYSFCRMLEGDCDLIALKDSPAGLRAKRLLNRLLGTPSR